MENSREVSHTPTDPRADLDLLQRSQSSVAVNEALNFGPWWYAPLLATCVGGLMLFGQDFGAAINIFFGAIGVGAGAAMALHDYRRRTVRPKFSGQAFALLVVAVLASWIVVGLWGTAISTIGYDDFVPLPALGAWVITVAAFLLVRQFSHSILARRQVRPT